MNGIGYLMGELNKADPNAEIKKEIAKYASNPSKYLAASTANPAAPVLSVPITFDTSINLQDKNLTRILTKPNLIDVPLSEFGKKSKAEIKRNLKKGLYSRNKPLTQAEQNKKVLDHVNNTIQENATEPAGSGNFDEPQNWHLTYNQYEEAKMKLEADKKKV